MKMFLVFAFIGFVAMIGLLSVVVPRADHRAQIAAQDRTAYLQKMGWDKDIRR